MSTLNIQHIIKQIHPSTTPTDPRGTAEAMDSMEAIHLASYVVLVGTEFQGLIIYICMNIKAISYIPAYQRTKASICSKL